VEFAKSRIYVSKLDIFLVKLRMAESRNPNHFAHAPGPHKIRGGLQGCDTPVDTKRFTTPPNKLTEANIALSNR
jgi:hypothetical protein